MKAMIFAAGLGTRLRPLTHDRPKALVEVGGKTLLEHSILKLISFGYSEVIINVHHFGQSVLDFLSTKKNFGIRIEVSDERDLLLETGGGLKKASWFFEEEEPFLLCNVDVLTNMDYKLLMDSHLVHKPLATLAVQDRITSRYLLFDSEANLCGWKNIRSGEQIMSRKTDNPPVSLAFSGIQIIDPKIFPLITEDGAFSTIPLFLRLAKSHTIRAFQHNSIWLDVGKPDQLREAEKLAGHIF